MSIPQVSNISLDAPRTGNARASAANAAATRAPQLAVRSSPVASDAAQEQRASPEQMTEAVQQMNRAMRMANSALEFRVDQDTDRVVVTISDRDTGEVVMQIPSEEALALSRHLNEAAKGALVSQKA
jgi:flagellar protein FlaG